MEMIDQPGDPEQLARAVMAAERWYEKMRVAVIVFWDEQAKRYRFAYASQYDREDCIEVVTIPK